MSDKHLDHIVFHRIRPRIKVETSLSPKKLHQIISTNLKDQKANIEGTVLPSFATIYPTKEHQHYWSPQLTLNIEEAEAGSLVRGLYGPRPSVWTMFIFFYSFIGFATMILSLIGLSLLSLDKDATILWLVPVLILLFMTLYLVAYLGQKFGQRQMIYLHHFLEECLQDRIETT